jgi:hypothetical protein
MPPFDRLERRAGAFSWASNQTAERGDVEMKIVVIGGTGTHRFEDRREAAQERT